MSIDKSYIYDVVVVGSGAGGLSAAVVAAIMGLRVLLVEKTPFFGGTTAWSGGGLWIPNNPRMAEIGETDSMESAKAYLRSVLGWYYNEDQMSAFLESGPEMIRYLEANTCVRFAATPLPDYYPSNSQARVGRTILTRDYNGRLLKGMLPKLRAPMAGFAAFGTMQTNPQYLNLFKNAFETWEGFRFSSRRFLNFLIDLVIFGKGAHLANGNALAGRLLQSAVEAGVTLWNATAATSLITEGNRVVGAEIEREGIGIPVMATHGVILATGGFGGDRELTGQWIPMPGDHVSIFPEGNVGDGIRLAKQARGVMGPTNTDNGVWVPISVRRNAAGRIIAKYPHFGSDRAKPGSIIVNFKGHRFANEAAPYQAFVNIMHQQRIAKAWLIGDHHMLRLYGMGLALPAPLPYKALIRDGYLIKAQSITLLAEAIGVDPVELENTVCRFNRYAVEGKDPDFHRGANIYDNAQGDFDLPSPNLGPLNSPPFYAVAIYPGDVSTVYGLKTSRDAQVLDASGSIVPGLYATGLDQNSIMRGFYPGGGCSIGPAMTFGFRAALSISASYHSVSKKVLGDRESTELQRE